MWDSQSVEQLVHTQPLLSLPCYIGAVCDAPKTMTIVTSKITADHHNKYNNNEKSLKYCKNFQNVTRTGSEQALLET